METTIIVNRVAFQNIVLQISEQILSLAFPTLIITKADNILAFSAIFQKKPIFQPFQLFQPPWPPCTQSLVSKEIFI